MCEWCGSLDVDEESHLVAIYDDGQITGYAATCSLCHDFWQDCH